MTPDPWLPTRQRLADTLLAAVAPVSACVLALGGLSAWTAAGNAGSPPRIGVTHARLYLPTGGTPQTAAFFRIDNTGDADDELVKVTSPAVPAGIALSRHHMVSGRAAYRETVPRLPVPAGGRLDMSPLTADVTVPVTGQWRDGDLVPFTLHFEHSAAVPALAVVVRSGAAGK
ncbi:copper chaperone PCu(A)C [Streptomyces bauhiniae]|uniref:copper chaperone PCu(A)C n=1 Tax=Streptomyces bauhiniae TaxID=2340725 RepID=UPI00331B9E2A